jgi:hypothetical protein
MNIYWRTVRKACGQWSLDGTIGATGDITSSDCASANSALLKNAFYVAPNADGTGTVKIPVSSALIESINIGLWSNSALKE